MQLSEIIRTENLTLAWRRIGTATNHQYKRIFRDLYTAYELAASENLRRLHARLRGNWQPTPPERIYLPKPSGLQRPLSLLHLEDQIVQQALANVFAKRLLVRRRGVELRYVFSSILAPAPNSIFFLRDWQDTYRKFQDTCRKHFRSGYRWIASFDLAAFYDTISHDLLIRAAAPRSFYATGSQRALSWLECWSQGAGFTPYKHGIAQGPIASDFLAESFLLSLDEDLARDGIRYVRYVDDIRLFAKSKSDAQRAAIRLEVLCRQRGLIPQGKKFLIAEAQTLDEVLGQLPSLPPREDEAEEPRRSLSAVEGERLIREAITGRPRRVTDKSKLRYVLFRAPRSRRILGIALRLLTRYPEHIDALLSYLRLFRGGKTIDGALKDALRWMPNEYVRGELWRHAASSGSSSLLRQLSAMARGDLTEKDQPFWQCSGALAFLLRCESAGLLRAAGRIQHRPLLAQSLLVSELGDAHFAKAAVVARLLECPSFEVSLPLAPRLAARRETHRTYGVAAKAIAPETQNVLRVLGIVGRRAGGRLDEVGEALTRRFGVTPSAEWKRVLAGEYLHALQLLVQAEAAYDASRSLWLQNLNSFNDALARRTLDLLAANGLPGASKTVGKDGKLVKFGSLLQVSGPFAAAHPVVAAGFRSANDRRNSLPLAHPYDEKTGTRNHHLSKKQQGALHTALSRAYAQLLVVFIAIPP